MADETTSTTPHSTRSPQRQPFAVVDVVATGIHPATHRIVTLAVTQVTATGEVTPPRTFVLNPHRDPGPYHLHQLEPDTLEDAPDFADIAEELVDLLSGHVVAMHHLPRTLGFLAAEFARTTERFPVSRALSLWEVAAHVGVPYLDHSFPALAEALGLPLPPQPTITARTQTAADALPRLQLRAEALGVDLPIRKLSSLATDEVGYLIPHALLKAAAFTPPYLNPGIVRGQGRLTQGMEICIAQDITTNLDTLLGALVGTGLSLTRRLTRDTSVVVTDRPDLLEGRVLHAVRKEIPVISSAEFLERTGSVRKGRRERRTTSS